VRGIDTHVRITPKTRGQYPVVCAELCGLGHAVMRQTAHVVEPQEFSQWVQERGQQAAGGEEGDETGGQAAAPDGKTVFTESGCGGCHELSDAGTSGGGGPNLDETLADADAPFIEESIVEPDAEIAEGFGAELMPETYGEQLTPPEIEALVKYLDEVTG
jgi:cytochrome c oxidase subunit 2